MAKRTIDLTVDEELLILLFWAYGKDISKRFGEEKLQAIPALRSAIEAVSHLPAAIGWDDEALAESQLPARPDR